MKEKTAANALAEAAAAVDYAVAAQRIEGLTVSPEAVEIMHRAARGEISDAESVRLIIDLYRLRASP